MSDGEIQNKGKAKRGNPAWTKGQSGNPGGRPKGFGTRIREVTKDGDELVSFALKVLRGELSVVRLTGEGQEIEVGPDIRERIEAMKFLADRGWGKPAQSITVEDEASKMSTEELRVAVAALLAAYDG